MFFSPFSILLSRSIRYTIHDITAYRFRNCTIHTLHDPFFFCTVRWCVFSTASSGRLSVQRPGDGERRVAHGGDGGDGDPTGVR